MYQQQQPNDRWMQFIAMMQVLRGQGSTPESQIHTNETVTIRSRAILPLTQGILIIVMFCGLALGIVLFTGGVDYLLDLGWEMRDFIAAWIGLLTLATGVAWAVKYFFSLSTRIVQAIIVVFVLLLVGVALSSLLLSGQDNDTGEMVKFVLGAAMILGCGLVLYNQAMDVAEPYWRRSPLEQAIIREVLPKLGDVLGGDEPVIIESDPRFPITKKNGVPVKMLEAPKPKRKIRKKKESPPAVPDVIETINPEAGNLIWFGLWALGCNNLTYEALTARPAPFLPFTENGRPNRLRRNMIQVMLARGSTNEVTEVNGKHIIGLGPKGWWHLRGQGATAEWAYPPGEVRQQIAKMWKEAMGDVPLPDPHKEVKYRYVKEEG